MKPFIKNQFALFLVLYFFANSARGQTGYIITQKKDTIPGTMKMAAFGRIKFKANNKPDFEVLNLDTVNEYQLPDSSVFSAKHLPSSSMNFISKPQFVQRLEHGKINLYEKVETSGQHLRTWYVSKGSDSLIAIKTEDIFLVGGGSKKSRQQLFENMLSDEPAVLTEFKANDKFDFDKIRGFIKLYNNTAAAPAK